MRCVDAVCRDEELGVLRDHLEAALEGSRRIVFITGEPGVGKTTLVDAFTGADALTRPLRLAIGQCIEHRGAGEAYLPVLEALGRLCRGAGGDVVVDILAREAPGWLVQVPGLLDAELQETVRRRALGTTRERMLREMVGALESLSADRPLVLWLEDLQWSDGSKIDLLDLLARRREPARLLVIGSFRPADHPVRDIARDLTLRGYSHLITLAPLTAEQVEVWLSVRFGGAAVPGAVARVLHLRTGGNLLFMENVVAYWLSQGRLKERDGRIELVGPLEALSAGVPESLRLALNRQIELLPDRAQDVLEAAAVSGMVCRSASVAAVLGVEIETAEDELAELAHRGICLSPGSPEHWADGTETASFSFTHNLYQDVIYGRISPAKRARMHYSVAERLETGYGEVATEHAAEIDHPYYLALLADACARSGRPDEALAAVDEALNRLRGLRGFYYDAELYRLRAELLQRLPGEPNEAAVEAALDEALLLSREHHARILELRALLSRCRWAQRRGRPKELALLAELYATFAEGLETPDLKAARALLTTV